MELNHETGSLKISEDFLEKSIFKQTVRNFINAPFDLYHYSIIFEPQNLSEKNCNYLYLFNFSGERRIFEEGRPYVLFKNVMINEAFKDIILEKPRESISIGCITIPEYQFYAKPYFRDIIIQFLLFILAWMGLHLIILEYYKYFIKIY